jgi:hypothetical protein
LFNRGAGRQPVVSATLLDHADGGSSSSLEFVNEGGPAENLVCLAEAGGRTQQVEVGSLGPGQTAAVRIDLPASGDWRCVWLCTGARGTQHVWSYDGRHEHAKERLSADAAFRQMYPAAKT